MTKRKYESCSIKGCSEKHHAKGLCQRHYNEAHWKDGLKARQQKAYRERVAEGLVKPKKFCSVEGCDKYHHAKGFCHLHYDRFLKVNNPDRAKIRRARKKKLKTEQFSSIEIFEKNNWICGICGKPVEKSLKFPDPMSASLDHIIPISKGGGHTRGNVQLAHLGCNMKKGANSTPTLVDVASEIRKER